MLVKNKHLDSDRSLNLNQKFKLKGTQSWHYHEINMEINFNVTLVS